MISRSPSRLGERNLLPARRGRPAPWVIGIMMFVTLVVAAAGLAVAGSARLVGEGVEHRHSVQIPDGAARVPAALSAIRRAPGVAGVEVVPESEVRGSLDRWLGSEAASADLPLPALIDVDLAPGADPRPVAEQLRQAVPEARMLSYGDRLEPVKRWLGAVGAVALGLVLLMIVAMGAAVVLATRGALESHRPTIEVMHGIGATDAQLAGLFERRIARDALVGGLAGAFLAALVLLTVGSLAGPLLAQLSGGGFLRPLDWLLLGILPFLATLMAMLVARTTVLRALRAAL